MRVCRSLRYVAIAGWLLLGRAESELCNENFLKPVDDISVKISLLILKII